MNLLAEMNSQNRQGGKQYGVLKAKQETYLTGINTAILNDEDFKYLHIESLAERLDIYKKKFMEFDTDNSGDIDFFELKQMLEKLGQPRTHLEAKKLLHDTAKSNSGAIGYLEFVEMLLGNVLGMGIVFPEEIEIEAQLKALKTGLKKKRQAPPPPSTSLVTAQPRKVSFKEEPEVHDSEPSLQSVDNDAASDYDNDDEDVEPPITGTTIATATVTNSAIATAVPSHLPPPYESTESSERRPPPVITTDVLPRTPQVNSQRNGHTPATAVVQNGVLPHAAPSVHRHATNPGQIPHTARSHTTPLEPPSVHLTPVHPSLQHVHQPIQHTQSAPVQPAHSNPVHLNPNPYNNGMVQGQQLYIQPCTVPGCTQCQNVVPNGSALPVGGQLNNGFTIATPMTQYQPNMMSSQPAMMSSQPGQMTHPGSYPTQNTCNCSVCLLSQGQSMYKTTAPCTCPSCNNNQSVGLPHHYPQYVPQVVQRQPVTHLVPQVVQLQPASHSGHPNGYALDRRLGSMSLS